MDAVSDFLVWLGSDPLMVGIAALIGLLAGVEFLIRYLVRTATLARWLARLGARRLKANARRAFKEDLVFTRQLRSPEFQARARGNLLRNMAMLASMLALCLAVALGAQALIDDDLTEAAWMGTALGMATRYFFSLALSYFALRRMARVVADPVGHRRYVLRQLKRLER